MTQNKQIRKRDKKEREKAKCGVLDHFLQHHCTTIHSHQVHACRHHDQVAFQAVCAGDEGDVRVEDVLEQVGVLKVVLYHSVLWLIFVFSPLSPNCPLVHFTCFAHISLNSCPFDFSLLSSCRSRVRAHLCCTRALIASHARPGRVHLFPY